MECQVVGPADYDVEMDESPPEPQQDFALPPSLPAVGREAKRAEKPAEFDFGAPMQSDGFQQSAPMLDLFSGVKKPVEGLIQKPEQKSVQRAAKKAAELAQKPEEKPYCMANVCRFDSPDVLAPFSPAMRGKLKTLAREVAYKMHRFWPEDKEADMWCQRLTDLDVSLTNFSEWLDEQDPMYHLRVCKCEYCRKNNL